MATKTAKTESTATATVLPENPALDLSAVELEALMAEMATRFRLPSPMHAFRALQWGRVAAKARCEIGKIKAKCRQVGDIAHSLKAKRTILVEGVSFNVSALPEQDIKELAKLTAITKAADKLDSVD